MDRDKIYNELNKLNLLEDLRGRGFDVITLNFDNGGGYIQANAFLLRALIEKVNQSKTGTEKLVVVGASMGGLVARYALAHMEKNNVDHQTRLFISFDSPQEGANIPLGDQYWISFFASEPAGQYDAINARKKLQTLAAKQMLVYHFEATGHVNSRGGTFTPLVRKHALRYQLQAELASLHYPNKFGIRKIAISNGSGAAKGQGYNPRQWMIYFRKRSFRVDIDGYSWALPGDPVDRNKIFHGNIDVLGPDKVLQKLRIKGNILPYDTAPGGKRYTNREIASGSGSVRAIVQHHCFIPTTSSLGINSNSSLYTNIAAHPNILTLSPFDAVYYPIENQDHVSITSENKKWFLDEITMTTRPVDQMLTDNIESSSLVKEFSLHQNHPNPFNPSTTIKYGLPIASQVKIQIYNMLGQHVRTLVNSHKKAGIKEVVWDGKNNSGSQVPSGVYIYRITAGNHFVDAKKMIMMK